MAKETLTSMLDYFINERLNQLVLSNPAEKDHLQKVKVRPMLIKGALVFQHDKRMNDYPLSILFLLYFIFLSF